MLVQAFVPAMKERGYGRIITVLSSVIKQPKMDLAEASLGALPILHVGDDWAADVVGASQAGWRTAYLRGRQHDTPLPTSNRAAETGVDAPADAIVPDLEIDELAELDALVDLAAPGTT